MYRATCSWKSLKPRPSTQVPIPQRYVDGTCHPIGRTQHYVSTAYQLHWPTHSIHPRDKGFYSFSGHFGFTRTRHYNLSAIHSVFNTLAHRARTVCANWQPLYKEEEHIRDALIKCKYSTWAFNRVKTKSKYNNSNTQAHTSSSDKTNNNQRITVTSTWWYLIARVSVKVSRTFVAR